MARIADQAHDNKQAPRAQMLLKQKAINQDQKQVFDDQAWKVVLEYLDLQMMEPNHTGAPTPTKDNPEDLVASYSSYKCHLEAFLPRDGLRYACVPGMDVETTMNPLDEGMLWSCMGMQQVKAAKDQDRAQGGMTPVREEPPEVACMFSGGGDARIHVAVHHNN